MSYPTRSRGGCWTCKRMHRKCDEQRPTCGPCSRGRKPCEGYSVKLVWKDPNEVPGSRHQAEAETEPEVASGQSPTQSPPRDPVVAAIPISDMQAKLLNDFQSFGHRTLGIRGLGRSPMFERAVPLSWESLPVSRICVAYQAYLEPVSRHLFVPYFEEAVQLFKETLKSGNIQDVTVLLTGILICSISITALLLWTPHIEGLVVILKQQGLDKPETPRSAFTQFLLDGAGLLDLPGTTIGRRNPCQRIWNKFVTPLRMSGVEPTSGLPRSLLDIMATIDATDMEYELLVWSPEKADHLLQYHFWEAYRLALLLFNHLRHHGDGKTRPNNGLIESLVMRILSCIHELQSDNDDPFPIALNKCVLLPLFYAALATDKQSTIRDLVSAEFEVFIRNRQEMSDQTAWAIIMEVWNQQAAEPNCRPLVMANQFATELEVELHLY